VSSMRVSFLLVSLVVVSVLVSLASASAIASEKHHNRQQRHQQQGKENKSFRLLERVQRQRLKEKQKLEHDKHMILKHAIDRDNKRIHQRHHHESLTTRTKHSLDTLSHGSEYVSNSVKREEQLLASDKLSSLLERHHNHQKESDKNELSSIHKLLNDLDKKNNKFSVALDNNNENFDYDENNKNKQKQNELRLEKREKLAKMRLRNMEKREKDRKEELLDNLSLGGTATVATLSELSSTEKVIKGLQISLLETNNKNKIRVANPPWAEKPSWWKVPPSEIGDAGNSPWPNDPLEQNGYPATMIDPNNYPLSNVDDPNNYPALDDPNGAFAPIQQPS
jgi:hypothetical protein